MALGQCVLNSSGLPWLSSRSFVDEPDLRVELELHTKEAQSLPNRNPAIIPRSAKCLTQAVFFWNAGGGSKILVAIHNYIISKDLLTEGTFMTFTVVIHEVMITEVFQLCIKAKAFLNFVPFIYLCNSICVIKLRLIIDIKLLTMYDMRQKCKGPFTIIKKSNFYLLKELH